MIKEKWLQSSVLSGYDARMMDIGSEYLRFQASKSSGPGGQNVNKVNTRVTVYFDLAAYPGFSETQKRRIWKELATRTNGSGVIRVTSQRFRTQQANRKAAVGRLGELLEKALERPRMRLKTRIPRAVHERRLKRKRERGHLKKLRSDKSYDRE